jgi:hypothetical protein
MPRTRWSSLVLGVLWACNAGPISDFPFKAGEDSPTSPSASADGGVVRPPAGDAGTPIVAPRDAGVPINVPSADGGSASGGSDAGGYDIPDAGPDGGVPPLPDGGGFPFPDDAGPSGGCPPIGSATACGGFFCGLDLADLRAESTPNAACTADPATLAAACSGALPSYVASRAQAQLGQGTSLSVDGLVACVGAAPSPPASAACVRCYAEEMDCALRACSAAFLAGGGESAAACRALVCAPRFAVCSGLPIAGY